MTRRRGQVIVSTLVAALATLSGCSEAKPAQTSDRAPSSQPESAPAPTDEGRAGRSPFAKFRSGGETWEIERFESLYQLVRRSDLVIVGKVTGARWGTEYREDRGDETEVFRDLIFEVEPVRGMRGKPVGPRQGQVDVVIDLVDPRSTQLQAPVGEDAVFFLRRVGNPIPGAPELGGSSSAGQKALPAGEQPRNS